jgi:Integrase core domain
MATLGVVYDATPAPRRAHDVICVPAATAEGPSGQRSRRIGPRAQAKWLTGSVTASSEQVIAAVFDQATQRDPSHRRPWVVLVDGARHQLDLVRAEAARRGVTVHILIDLIHVLEYLWKAAWCLHADGDPHAEAWVATHAISILSGHLVQTITAIDAQAADAGLSGGQRRGIDTCIGYLQAKQEFLGYDTALAAGWPIATGVIEGACRHLIGDRLDISGARWGLSRAALAAQPARVSGRYEAERPNQRWIGDVLTGPFVPHPRVAGSQRAKLFMLDDHSRLLVHGRWVVEENTRAGHDVLRAAIVRRGLPEALYVDNGAPYAMRRCSAAARCWAFAWSTASPTGPGQGKQERLNRVIRERFLLEAEHTGIDSLDQLNDRFHAWAEQVCNTRVHTETGQTPIQRWQAGGPPRAADPVLMREAFGWSVIRVVTKTATVSLAGNRYQVDPRCAATGSSCAPTQKTSPA